MEGSQESSAGDDDAQAVDTFLELHKVAVEKWLLEKADPEMVQRILAARAFSFQPPRKNAPQLNGLDGASPLSVANNQSETELQDLPECSESVLNFHGNEEATEVDDDTSNKPKTSVKEISNAIQGKLASSVEDDLDHSCSTKSPRNSSPEYHRNALSPESSTAKTVSPQCSSPREPSPTRCQFGSASPPTEEQHKPKSPHRSSFRKNRSSFRTHRKSFRSSRHSSPDFSGRQQRSRSSSNASLLAEEDLGGRSNGVIPRSKRNSVTSELFQMWLTASPKRAKSPSRPVGIGYRRQQLDMLDEGEMFMELIRDVANELDIDVLCHKILVNVGLLTHADRGSLFLARGPREGRYLSAKLFDVTVDTDLEDAIRSAKAEEIRIPFGVGIAGSVAQSKEYINIKDAYQDPRFNSEIDHRTGYKTSIILSMPICNYEGEVIGVAQIINKTDGMMEFTQHDVEVFQRYLTFCGIGIQNAQLFEMSVVEFRRNQILLNLARSIFEEQNNLECLVTKIMTEARELLKCERCAVFLLDTECCEASHYEKILERPSRALPERKPLCRRESNNVKIEDILQQRNIHFTTVFELRAPAEDALVSRPNQGELGRSPLAQIARYVAATGQILNIGDVATWMNQEVREDEDGFLTRSILCMPIVNGQKTVIGVAQLINKGSGIPFSDCDVSIFEAFAIFCGLGIHNTQMYENACKLMAKQKVALECLSYHATASHEDTAKLNEDSIPSADTFNLYSYKFVDFDLSDEDTCRATVRMFLQCNLVKQFHIPYEVLCRWVLSVKKNYRPVKYHNWRHALNVAQTMFAMLKTGKMERFMKDLEILGLLVACLCHDLDHRGTNNAFQTKTESPLAILYSTSTMEHHHFDQCVMILNSEGNNIFQSLSTEDYRNVMKTVENAIISTDLAMYFKKKNCFMECVENGEFDWQSDLNKELLCGMMMTACDVSAIAKPWEVQHKVAKLVADEFFDQGDLEKLQLNQQPVAMMDRERKDELPQMQVGFIDVICLPLYKVLSETFPWIQPLYDGCLENRSNWQDLAEKVEMGLTWIDHDTIDKPVEEFTTNSEPKDIEFTVTTLNCTHANTDTSGHHATNPRHSTTNTAVSTLGRFASLRRGKTIGKSVKERLTSSMHSQGSVAHTPEMARAAPPAEINKKKSVDQPRKTKQNKSKSKLCVLF